MNLLCGKILNVLGNCVIGIAIGLVVALIISLILHFTCFKEKNMMILYVVMLVLFAACGGFVQYKYFNSNVEISVTPQEQVDSVIDAIGNNWTNTNGGFSFDQIMNIKDDDTAPVCDDQIIDMVCYDFGSYIVFSYKNGNVYENAMFYKSSNGLILDGMINMSAKMNNKYKFPWWRYVHDTFRWIDGRDKAPEYYKKKNFLGQGNDNLISLSSQTASFFYDDKIPMGYDDACNYAMQQASVLTGKNVADRFIKFGDVELIGTAGTGYAKINSFYNYLYEQIKGQDYGATKLVGCNSSLCVVVPDNLRQNYPIPADKKSEYGDSEFYGVYKCDIAVNLKYVQGNKTYTSTTKNEEYFEELENDKDYKDKVQVDEVEETAAYSKLNLSFRDTGNSDLTSLNLLTSPIKIVLQNATTGDTKTVVVDTLDKLQNGEYRPIPAHFQESGEVVFNEDWENEEFVPYLTREDDNYIYIYVIDQGNGVEYNMAYCDKATGKVYYDFTNGDLLPGESELVVEMTPFVDFTVCAHAWQEDLTYAPNPPLCGEMWDMKYTCALCGCSEFRWFGPLQHDYVDGVCHRCGELSNPHIYIEEDVLHLSYIATDGTYNIYYTNLSTGVSSSYVAGNVTEFDLKLLLDRDFDPMIVGETYEITVIFSSDSSFVFSEEVVYYTATDSNENISLTWMFNDTIATFENTIDYAVNFISNGRQFCGVRFTIGAAPCMEYVDNSGSVLVAYDSCGGWMFGEEYKTIVFDVEPDGVILEYLQANAILMV